MKVKRIIAMLMVSFITASMIVGCGTSSDVQSDSSTTEKTKDNNEEVAEDATSVASADSKKTTLTFWNGFTSTDGDVLQTIVNDFNNSNEYGITIEMDIMPWDTFNEKLPAAIASGDAPDFVLCSSGYYPAYVNAGSFQDLSDFYESDGVNADDFEENVKNLLYYDDVCIGIPMQMVSHYLFWDKDLYKAAGIDPDKAPTSFEEIVENAQKLTDKSKNQYGFVLPTTNNIPAQYTMYAHGGRYVNDDETKSEFNSAENLSAFETMKTLYACSPQDTDDNTYISGQCAQFINGPWIINGLRENDINFGVTAVPMCEGVEKTAAVIPVGFSIPTTTTDEHKQLVYQFIKYWNTEEICTKWTQECGTPAYLKSAEKNFADDQLTSALSVPLTYGHIECKKNGVSRIATDALYPAMEEVFDGADIQTTLDKYSSTIQGILDGD